MRTCLLLLLVFACFLPSPVIGDILFSETFSYSDGNLSLKRDAWTVHSGTVPLFVDDGQAIIRQNLTDGADIGIDYSTLSVTEVYYSYDISVEEIQTGSVYFAHMQGGSFKGRNFISSSGSNSYLGIGVGFQAESETIGYPNPEITWFTNPLAHNNRVVGRVNIESTEHQFWVNPTSQASPSLIVADSFSPVTKRFSLRQSSVGSDARIAIDNLVIADNWDQAFTRPTSNLGRAAAQVDQNTVEVADQTPGKTKLMAFIHGWDGPSGDANDHEWLNTAETAVHNKLDADPTTVWDVSIQRWNAGENNSGGDPFFWAGPNAKEQGKDFADKILATTYDEIHIVAHSAGALFAAEAVDRILQGNPDMKITVTYLDPFVGAELVNPVLGIGGLSAEVDSPDEILIRHADKVRYENYMTRDIPFTDSVFETQGVLNVDLTYASMDGGVSATANGHGFAYEWYIESILQEGGSQFNNIGFANSSYRTGTPTTGNPDEGAPVYYDMSSGVFEFDVVDTQAITVNAKRAIDILFDANSSIQNATASTLTRVINDVSTDLEGVNLLTQSPAWYSQIIEFAELTNFIEVDYEFLSNAQGVLGIYIENQLIGVLRRTI